MHSADYFREMLALAERNNKQKFSDAVRCLRSKAVDVTIEAQADEHFGLVPTPEALLNVLPNGPEPADIALRISPGWFRRILEGVETPVEAFFLGHLRAKGLTRDLYGFHAFFVALAEIAISVPEIQDLIEAFQKEKEVSG